MKKEILEWIVAIAVAIALIAIITKFVGKSYSIKGDSMDPTLKDGERVVVNIIGYKLGGVEKGMSLYFMLIKKMIMLKELLELQVIVLNIKMIHSMLMVKSNQNHT